MATDFCVEFCFLNSIDIFLTVFMKFSDKMKINSCAALIFTPVKKDTNGESKTPEKPQRSSPSSDLQHMLLAIDRVHRFSHKPDLVPLGSMKLTIKTRNLVREVFLDFNFKLDNWMSNLENSCSEAEMFSAFQQNYIHYEFYIKKEFSFAVIILLNYMNKYRLNLEEAFLELFQVSTEMTVCPECCEHKLDGNTTKIIRTKNLDYLKKLVVNGCIDDNIVCDSDTDPDFKPRKGDLEEESSSDDSVRTVQQVNLVADDAGMQFSDDDENDHVPRRKMPGARKEKTYSPRFSDDMKLVKDNRDLRGSKSELSDNMKNKLGSRVNYAREGTEDEELRVRIERRMVENSKSFKSGKKLSTRSVEVDNASTDEKDKKKSTILNTNPFVESVGKSDDPYEFMEDSSELCNPFLVSEDDDENIACQSTPKTSSVKKSRLKHDCEHCMKQFSSKYNLSLHLIQVHRIFVSGIKVFECPEVSCRFVVGSQILYNRHATTHVRRAARRNVCKISSLRRNCNICGLSLSNPSALKRHIRRKHE